MKLKLAIEPRPSSTWGITLANLLPKKEWDEIRFDCYREADYQCEICENVNDKLHCHEVWGFDDRKKIQKLLTIICLCILCHDVKHFGRSSQVYDKKRVEKLIIHWCKVNDKTKADFQKHLAEIRIINRKRADKYYIVKVGRRTLI